MRRTPSQNINQPISNHWTMSTTQLPECTVSSNRRLQTRDGRLMRRIMARARTEVRREAQRLILQLVSSPVTTPPSTPKSKVKLDPQEKRMRKRVQNRRSIEKCRRRDLFRRARLTAESASLVHDNLVLADALDRVRNSGALEIFTAYNGCSKLLPLSFPPI